MNILKLKQIFRKEGYSGLKAVSSLIALSAITLSTLPSANAEDKLHDFFYVGVGQDSVFGLYNYGGAIFSLDPESNLEVQSVLLPSLIPGTLLSTNIANGSTLAGGTWNSARSFVVQTNINYSRMFMGNALKTTLGLSVFTGSFFSSPFAPTTRLVDALGPNFLIGYENAMLESELQVTYAIATATQTATTANPYLGINQNVLLFHLNVGYKISPHFTLGLINDNARTFIAGNPSLPSADYFRTYGGYLNIKMTNGMSLKFIGASDQAANSSGQYFKSQITLPFMI